MKSKKKYKKKKLNKGGANGEGSSNYNNLDIQLIERVDYLLNDLVLNSNNIFDSIEQEINDTKNEIYNLLEKGANPNIIINKPSSFFKGPAIIILAQNGFYEIIDKFIYYKADVNIINNFNETNKYLLLTIINNLLMNKDYQNVNLIEYYIKKGCNPNIINNLIQNTINIPIIGAFDQQIQAELDIWNIMKLNILKSLIENINHITNQDLELFEEYFNISNIKTKLDEIKYKQKSLNFKKQFGLNIKKTISKYLMDENFSDLEKKIYNVWLLFRNKTNPKKYNNHRFKTNNN